MITVEEAKKIAANIINLVQQVKFIKQQRENIDEKIAKAEVMEKQDVVSHLSKENGDLAKQLISLHAQIKFIKHQLAKDIAESQNTFELLGAINEIESFLAKELNQLVILYDTFNTKLAEEIKIHYGLTDAQKLKVLAKESGASTGFVVQANGHQFYIKESLSYRDEKKINPKELFVYKLLEYTHIGPKAEFILKSFSTSRTGAQICYISTQDVEYSKTDSKGKTFTTDNPDDYTADIIEGKEAQWDQSLRDENFRVELIALSILDDIFLLNDSLRTNPSNYGTLLITDGHHTRYKPKLIDHLPDCKNISFSYPSITYAIQSLKDKLQINMQRRAHSKKRSPFSFALFQKREADGQDYFVESDSQQACVRLLQGIPGKEASDILSAMASAKSDIYMLIDQFPDSFVDDAKTVLEEYCDKAEINIAKIKSIMPTIEHPTP